MFHFKTLIAVPALAIALAFASGSAYAGPRDTVTRACAASALPSSALIQVKTVSHDKDGNTVEGRSIGSGSVIDSRGFVLTNQHVIANGTEIKVSLYGDHGEWRPAEVIFSDANVDLAVLRIDTGKNEKLPEMELGPSSDLAVGEPAIVIGSPYGDAFSVSAGIVSKIQMPKSDDSDIYLIQTDAAVNPGNSGGMLLNANCEQVGVIELKMGPDGIGFAITADRAARVLASYMSAEKFGVYHGIRAVTLKVVAAEGPDRQTVSVEEMAVGSPAAAVLQLGDQIDTIDGRHVGNQFDLERFFAVKRPGDQVKLHIERAGKPMDVILTLAPAPALKQVKD